MFALRVQTAVHTKVLVGLYPYLVNVVSLLVQVVVVCGDLRLGVIIRTTLNLCTCHNGHASHVLENLIHLCYDTKKISRLDVPRRGC